jgi:hypothetical protein
MSFFAVDELRRFYPFLLKRLVLLCAAVCLIVLFISKLSILSIPAVVLGTLFSFLRFHILLTTLAFIFQRKMDQKKGGMFVFKYIGLQLLTAGIFILTILYDFWFFIGFSVGVLTIPAVILINSLTEGLGITNNGFTLIQQKAAE